MNSLFYPLLRIRTILTKELIHVKRDFLTYLMIVILPFAQVILFGYIINTNPKFLPMVIIQNDSGIIAQNFIRDLENTQYFKVIAIAKNEANADEFLKSGRALFVLNIPLNFTKDVIKEKQPHIVLESDGSDPVAIINPINAAKTVADNSLSHYANGPLNYLRATQPLFVLDSQVKYNPALISQYHTLPGLLVVILSITLPLITAISLTREYEYGTIESLLMTPVKASDIILGKVIPQVFLGYIILILALIVTRFLFHVPFVGSLFLYLFLSFIFLSANLGVGLFAAALSDNQLRAANITNSYVLPSTLLSGFLFPFFGMPYWAQVIGDMLPPAHFLRITNNILLKGSTFTDVWRDVWPIIIFIIVTHAIAIKFYRSTLD